MAMTEVIKLLAIDATLNQKLLAIGYHCLFQATRFQLVLVKRNHCW